MAETFLHGVEVIEITDGPRPIRTVRSGVIGIVGTAPEALEEIPLNTPVLIAGSRAEAEKLGTTGTLPAAIDGIFDQIGAVVVVVRVDEGADEDGTLENVRNGVLDLLGAESVIGYAPRILCAPGWTHQRPGGLKNPVLTELESVTDRLRAIAVVDGPNTDFSDAVTYVGDTGSRRIYVVDPHVKPDADTSEPASARVAGLIAKIDNDRGFWWSPSNQEMSGIVGTDRPIPFALSDANAEANLLNENKVATIIRQNGYRLWGNLTASADPKWQFLSVVRTADIINDSILRAHLWAVDRNITKTYLEDVTESVNGYLKTLKNLGAILGGECWPDPDLNSPANIALGKVYFNFDFTPPYPAQTITFRSQLVNDYLEELV